MSTTPYFSSTGRGTEGYRAPELLREAPTYTNKVDIWALGCVFYEILFRQKPFTRDSLVQQYFFTEETLTIPAVSGMAGISTEFIGTLIQKMLDRDSLLRPTAPEVQNELNQSSRLPMSIYHSS
jgi:serine/threonine protein kinase